MTWRGFKTFVGIALVFGMAFLFIGETMSQDLGTSDRPIHMLLLLRGASDAQEIGENIAADLQKRTGLHIVVTLLTDPAPMIAEFTASKGDTLGFLAADQYIHAYELTNGNITPRLGQVLYGYPYYYSSIYARRDSGIKSPEDCDGLVWCYNYTGSTSGYVLPNMLFNNKGIQPGRTVETGGQTNSMLALIERQCDFCTGYGSAPGAPSAWNGRVWNFGDDPEVWIWDRCLEDLYPEEYRGTCYDLRRAVRKTYNFDTVLRDIGVVANIGPIPNSCLAFGPDFPTDVADMIVAAIQDQFNDEEMKALWGDENFYWWDAVAPIDDSSYDGYRTLLGVQIPEGREVAVGTMVEPADPWWVAWDEPSLQLADYANYMTGIWLGYHPCTTPVRTTKHPEVPIFIDQIGAFVYEGSGEGDGFTTIVFTVDSSLGTVSGVTLDASSIGLGVLEAEGAKGESGFLFFLDSTVTVEPGDYNLTYMVALEAEIIKGVLPVVVVDKKPAPYYTASVTGIPGTVTVDQLSAAACGLNITKKFTPGKKAAGCDEYRWIQVISTNSPITAGAPSSYVDPRPNDDPPGAHANDPFYWTNGEAKGKNNAPAGKPRNPQFSDRPSRPAPKKGHVWWHAELVLVCVRNGKTDKLLHSQHYYFFKFPDGTVWQGHYAGTSGGSWLFRYILKRDFSGYKFE